MIIEVKNVIKIYTRRVKYYTSSYIHSMKLLYFFSGIVCEIL